MMYKYLLSSKGFSILETLVSLAIFSIGTLAVAQAFTSQLAFNNRSELRSGAINAAQQVLDELRVIDPTTLPTSGTSTPQNIVIGGKTYVVTIAYCQATSHCSSSTVRDLKVTVQHKNTTIYNVETVYAQLR
jgi:prepilin-type N-terminal cleavage/methylation domain-containing protein